MIAELGVDLRVLAAPMAGGPTTPALVRAAAEAGSLGFLAAGYKSVDALAAEIAAVRGVAFGVNVFVPTPVPVDVAEFRRYAELIGPEATRYGLALSAVEPRCDDDSWSGKIDLLVDDPVPLVSFTFGIPDATVLARLRQVGTLVAQTVTSVAEARRAAAAGVDVVVAQASAAGGHSGTFTPEQPPADLPLIELVAQVRAVTELPLWAAGGLTTAAAVADALHAGVDAVVVGTALLLADEAGTSAPMRAALADPNRTGTVVTRAFTGRPARALRNDFVDRYTAAAPAGYPALHHLTSPLRRAATAAGDPERINLWAGTGYRDIVAGPAGEILAGLAG